MVLAIPLLALVGGLVIYPVVQLVIDATGQPSGLGNFPAFFESSANVRALWVTFLTSTIITVLCVIFGSILAWRLATMRSRAGRIVLWVAIFSPFWMGVVVKNYAFTILLARNGPINDLLVATGLAGEPLQILYTQLAVCIGMLYTMLPYAVLPLFASVQGFDRTLLAAAQGLGASHTYAIVTVLLPALLPAMFASATIVFVICLGFYVTPVLLGGLSLPFLATIISQDLFQYYEYTNAAVAGTILIVAAFLSLGVTMLLIGRERLERAIL